MGLYDLIRKFWGIDQQTQPVLDELPQEPYRRRDWYQAREVDPGQLQALVDEIIVPLRPFISNVRIQAGALQQIQFEVQLRNGLRWFNFDMKCRLSDVWHDPWTSTAELEIVDVHSPRLADYFSAYLQGVIGRWLIRLFDFIGPLFPRDQKHGAEIRLQAKTLHVNFRPWVKEYFQSTPQGASPWLEFFFGGTGQPNRGRRIFAHSIIFGAETSAQGHVNLYMYRLPGRVHVTTAAVERNDSESLYWGGVLEWTLSLSTSLILVSLLVPFALAYLHLEPVHFNDLFSLPKLFAYNIAIVLVPFWILRMTMMPVRNMWSKRQGQVDVLRAEVKRDRIFLPLLKDWVLEMRRMEMPGSTKALQDKMREWILLIGDQRRLLHEKLRDIERQQRISFGVLILGYVAVTALEYALWQGYISGPEVYAERIHSLLASVLLGR